MHTHTHAKVALQSILVACFPHKQLLVKLRLSKADTEPTQRLCVYKGTEEDLPSRGASSRAEGPASSPNQLLVEGAHDSCSSVMLVGRACGKHDAHNGRQPQESYEGNSAFSFCKLQRVCGSVIATVGPLAASCLSQAARQ